MRGLAALQPGAIPMCLVGEMHKEFGGGLIGFAADYAVSAQTSAFLATSNDCFWRTSDAPEQNWVGRFARKAEFAEAGLRVDLRLPPMQANRSPAMEAGPSSEEIMPAVHRLFR